MTDNQKQSNNALYYLGIIEGVAQARGEDAYPVKFWHSLKMLGEILQAPKVTDAPSAETAATPKAAAKLANDIVIASLSEPRCNGGDDEARVIPAVTNIWQDWQINLLREMKERGETNKAIGIACEKTQTQVANKCFMLGITKGNSNQKTEENAC